MRVTVTQAVGEDSFVIIWAESKTTKAQWQRAVMNVATHGPDGLPANVIFNLLKATHILSSFSMI